MKNIGTCNVTGTVNNAYAVVIETGRKAQEVISPLALVETEPNRKVKPYSELLVEYAPSNDCQPIKRGVSVDPDVLKTNWLEGEREEATSKVKPRCSCEVNGLGGEVNSS